MISVARSVAGLAAAGALLAPGAAPAATTHDPLAGGRVTLFAGGYSPGFTGDGGLAVDAGLDTPRGLALDTKGALYVADSSNLRVRRIAAGRISTVAGNGAYGEAGDGGPALAASLYFPYSLAVRPDGRLLIASERDELGAARVRAVDATGMIGAFAGTAPARTLAADDKGDVYIGAGARIEQVDPAGVVHPFAGTGVPGFAGDGGPATAAQLEDVSALAVEPGGVVDVADGSRIRRIDAAGTITTIAGTGSAGFSGDGGPATSARLFAPAALAADGHGTLYVADTPNHRIRSIDAAGTIATIAGTGSTDFSSPYGLARNVTLENPQGLAVDAHGDLLIADSFHDRILRLSSPLGGAAAARCSHAAARQIAEQHGMGNAGYTDQPVAQVLCGHFAGRRAAAMAFSLSIPSCGLSSGWLVYRLAGGRWRKVVNVRHGAYLTVSHGRIHEWQGVLGPTDAHCFPSSARTRAWRWDGTRLVHGGWQRKGALPKHLPGLTKP